MIRQPENNTPVFRLPLALPPRLIQINVQNMLAAMQATEQAADHRTSVANIGAVFGFGLQAQPFYDLGDALLF